MDRSYGTDPRRRFSSADRRRVWENQKRRCGVEPYDDKSGTVLNGCGRYVLDRDGQFHMHHVSPHAKGGPSTIGNALGLCSHCHDRIDHSDLSGPPQPTLREWQADHFKDAVTKLTEPGARHTTAVAPGGGKTLFAGTVARRLLDDGIIERVVTVSPSAHLVGQWAENLANDVQVYLDDTAKGRPWNMRHGFHGVSVTWHSLSRQQSVDQHIDLALNHPTLFILDEVHHAAEQASWGLAVRAIQRAAPMTRFMNLSGTLFRSARGELIATVDYADRGGAYLEATADVTIFCSELIEKRVLRDLELYEWDTTVHPVELDGTETTTLGVAGENTEIQAALLGDETWVRNFLEQWTAHLHDQRAFFDGYPFKGLVVASNVQHATLYKHILLDLIPDQKVWVANYEEPQRARQSLEDARKSRKPGVLVAIAMASEGYDNPDLSSVAHLSNVAARLRLAQIAGRVMRPTRTERDRHLNLAGTVWVPAVPDLVEQWRNVLINDLHTVAVTDMLCGRCGQPRPCMCPRGARICDRCGRPKPCRCTPDPFPQDPTAYEFGTPELTGVHLNGQQQDLDAYQQLVAACQAAGRPEYAVFMLNLAEIVKHIPDPVNFIRNLHKDQP
jgi:superfamily II DNA or RNA helicase